MLFNREKLISILPWAFTVCFILSATFSQLASDIEPWVDRAPIEYFTGGLLWMLSLLWLLLAFSPRQEKSFLSYWIPGCVALAILAIDEAMAGHEWVESNWQFNDDYPKIVLWLLTPKILSIAYNKIKPSAKIKYVLAVGYIFQSSYIFFEISDGEFYDISTILTKTQARWGEEFCELFFLSAYWLGYVLVYQKLMLPGRESRETRQG
jgi:hypothetical protein